MKEQLEKDLKKHKKILVLSVLGLIFSALFVVIYYLQNDKTFIAFIGVLAIDIYELNKELKRYKETKSKLQEL